MYKSEKAQINFKILSRGFHIICSNRFLNVIKIFPIITFLISTSIVLKYNQYQIIIGKKFDIINVFIEISAVYVIINIFFMAMLISVYNFQSFSRTNKDLKNYVVRFDVMLLILIFFFSFMNVALFYEYPLYNLVIR